MNKIKKKDIKFICLEIDLVKINYQKQSFFKANKSYSEFCLFVYESYFKLWANLFNIFFLSNQTLKKILLKVI